MADNTQTEELTFEDVEFTAPAAQDFVTVPEDDYILECIGFQTVDKPEQRITFELESRRKKNKNVTAEDIDAQQWEWLFRIAEGEFEGETLKDWTNRSWHEKSTAGIYAAALVGLEKYERQAMIDKGFSSTRALLGLKLKATVVEVQKKDGSYRNYINNPRRLPTARPRPLRPKQDDTPAVPYQELPRDIFENADAD